MDGSRSERARARALHLLAQIAPLPDDSEVQRLRELSLDYIREAGRREGAPEAGEQISAALDAIARDYFARALQKKSKERAKTPTLCGDYNGMRALQSRGISRLDFAKISSQFEQAIP